MVRVGLLALLLGLPAVRVAAVQAPALGALSRLPVKEVTVFKDGHAYVLHEGKVTAESDGEVRMDYLPTPVLGTFWVYSTDAKTPVKHVTASRRRVSVDRTSLSLAELIEGNKGAEVSVREKTGAPYEAKIVGFPTRTAAEHEATSPPNSEERLPERSTLVQFATASGVISVPFERIEAVTFKAEPKKTLAQEEFRNVLTVGIPGKAKGAEAGIGMVYVQKGIRWIPSYQVVIDGKGTAKLKMQATLINELIDLQDATVHLVIGVPTFAFKDTPDPIGLQQTFAQLSQYFQPADRMGNTLSNAIMSQTAGRMGERVAGMGGAGGFGGGVPDVPEIEGQEKAEDLFVFRLAHVTLKKGARMVLPVSEFTIPYRDVYTLDVPYAPPTEVRQNVGRDQDAEIARALAAPKVQHKLRLQNKSAFPLTTAPALILSEGRVLAQGMMTYTAIGGDTDLALTTAVDVKVRRNDVETGREPNALNRNGTQYGRTNLTGTITLRNFATSAIELEVTRRVLGHVDKVEAGGTMAMIDVWDEEAGVGRPIWWYSYPWPWWWRQVNGVGQFTWKVKLEAGKETSLGYAWHYFWQ